jgi:shikimate kinase
MSSTPRPLEVSASKEYTMKIVLIGPRGSGKSSVARLLAQRLHLQLINMDAMITRRAGMTIPALVNQYGWDHFRTLESAVAADLAECEDCVIDTGGGVVVHASNTIHLKRHGLVIFLTADPATLIHRIKDSASRPALTTDKSFTEEVQEILTARQPLYEAAADYTVNTSHWTIEQVVDDIIHYIRVRE